MKKLLWIAGLLASFALHASPVNVNGADARTIAKALNGIGKVKSAAIIQYREEHGDFKTADDLMNVKGVSYRIVEKNRVDILLSDPLPAQ